jgi:hypothetical protein
MTKKIAKLFPFLDGSEPIQDISDEYGNVDWFRDQFDDLLFGDIDQAINDDTLDHADDDYDVTGFEHNYYEGDDDDDAPVLYHIVRN